MLAVWLPLLGDIDNQGLCPITVISGTPVWLDNGKIGQGLSLNSRVGFNCSALSGCKKFTVAFWVRIDDNPEITTNWLDVFRFNDQKADNSAIGYLRAETSYGSTSYYGVHWHDNATNAIASSLPTHYSGNRGVWKHCVLTVDSDVELKAYTDGVLVSTKSTSNGGHITGTFYTGESGVIGCMNDVRIWKDQILTDDEIYELSRGLIAWFPLSPRPVYKITGDNIFTTSNIAKANSSSSYSVSAISDTSFRLYTNKNVAYASTKQTVASLGLTVGKRYRMKCKIDITRLDTRIIVGLRDSNNTFRASTGPLYDGGIYEYEFVLTSDISYLSFLGTYESSQCDITFSDIEIYELQEENIIHDISGYQRNGTKTNVVFSPDTPKYKGSSYFDGTSLIQANPLSSEVKTISVWCKTTKNKSTSQFICQDSASGLCVTFYKGTIISHLGGSSSTGSKCTLGDSYIENGWNHFVVLKTGTHTREVYCNGVKLTPTSNDYWSAYAGFLIGARNTSNGVPFYGYISDLRAYATLLSEEDILELYHARISLISSDILQT